MGDRTRTLTPARVGFGALFAASLALAFPFRAGELRFDVGWLAAWGVLAPLVLCTRGLAPRAAFVHGTLWATLGYAGVLYWIYVVVAVHGHAPGWVAVAATLLLSLYVGVHVGAAAWVAARLEAGAGALAFAVLPLAWVAAEHLRTFDLWSGFPWAYLGYAAIGDGPIRALAPLGGVYGLSLLYALCGALLASRRFRAAATLFAGAHALGFGLGLTEPGWAGGGATVAEPQRAVGLVQANIPQEQKWDRSLAQEAFQAHLDISRLAAAAGEVDVIIWPEASVPVVLDWEPEYQAQVQDLARETGASLLLGGMAVEPAGPQRWRFYNSVFAIGPDGAYVDRYDKSRLVPFGEYVPMRSLLGRLGALATGLASGDVTPGAGPRALEIASLGGDHALAPLICYEVIYPGLVRNAVERGARVLLNVTNDAWYGRTSAPHQFLAIAAMRSAEHGVPMLRAANTGVSAVIDAAGAIREETPIFERRALRALVPGARQGQTPYTRLGDWVVWGSWGILIAIGGTGVVRTRRGRAV